MFTLAPRLSLGVRRVWLIAVALLGLAGSFLVMGAQADAASAAPLSLSVSAGFVVPGDSDTPMGRAWR